MDRIPIDLGGMKASGMAVTTYYRVKQLLGMNSSTRVWDARFMLALVEDEFRARFGIDTVPLDWSSVFDQVQLDREWVPRRTFDGIETLFPPKTRIAEEHDGSWVLLRPDGTPTTYRMPKGGYYFDDLSFNRGDRIDPTRFRPVDDVPDEQLEIFARYAKSLHENTQCAILGWGFGLCFLGLSLITDRRCNVTMGMPNVWMIMLMTEKETCHEMMGRAVDASIKCMNLINQAVGRYCVARGIAADDAGTQRRQFINPELWAEMIKPHYRRYCEWFTAIAR